MAQQTDARPSLALPDASAASTHRPPSPLRHAFVHEDSDDDSASPASSVSQLAAGLAHRVGNFVSGSLPAQRLPTDAELEAEAQREREKSRREAERILTREAEERRKAEERMLAMRDTADSLPLPPSRAQTMSNPPSPSPSGSPKTKESWWTAAKNRLTPTKEKEPLTPAQQVILEAKTREKSEKVSNSKEWPSNPQAKFNDPALLKLAVPPGPPARPVPTSPVSPTPSRTQAPILTPSPLRSISESAQSPSRDTPPLYAQFTPQGTLDVHGTLLTIARRFEKLEKWTVGHVRALEERMNDVERWLVEKEKEKEKEDKIQKDTPPSVTADEEQPPAASHDMSEIREELAELQGRVGELGREMARMSTSRGRRDSPSSAPSSLPPSHVGSGFITPHHTRLSSMTARESTSPPMASSNKPSGTRLPYPAGDYASPSDNLFSPAHSPPSSVNSATNSRPIAIPNTTNTTNISITAGNGNTTALNTNIPMGSSTSLSTSYSSASFSSVSSMSSRPLPASPKFTSHSASSSISIPRMASPSPMSSSPHAQQASAVTSASTLSLPPPPKLPSSATSSPSGSTSGKRQTSVSPTPRKRYTVALGEPIVARDSQQHQQQQQQQQQQQHQQQQHVQEREKERELLPPSSPGQLVRRKHARRASVSGTAAFYAALDSGASDKEGEEQEQEESGNEGPRRAGNGDESGEDETIGKSAASKTMATGAAGASEGGHSDVNLGERPRSPPSQASPQRPTKRRVRPQSAYDFSSILNQNQKTQVHSQSQSGVGHLGMIKSAPLQQRSSQQSFQSHSSQGSVSGASSFGSSTGSVAPLKPRWRSQSIDPGRAGRGGEGGGASGGGAGGGGDVRASRFIDPLVLRRQGRERDAHTGFKLPMQKPIGKVPIGDLVAFFDGDKRGEK